MLSENGWATLEPNSPTLYTWTIPTKSGVVKLRYRNGSVGFLLAFWCGLFSDRVEKVVGPILDDWGYAPRPVRGSEVPSNHYSGTAEDLNATRHPLGAIGTFLKAGLIRLLLKRRMRGLIRWGGDYHNRKDEMHFEIAPGVTMQQCEQLARKLMKSRRGKRLLEANKVQRAVILS